MTFFDNFRFHNLVAACRGCRAYYPENTLAAFTGSLGKCDFIELDIQLSRDLVPVVIHDPTLGRTSNAPLRGPQMGITSLLVKDWSLLELKSLDFSSWFYHTDPFGTLEGFGSPKKNALHLPQTILTLEEVLRSPSLSKIPINIEIKDRSGTTNNEKVTGCVLDIIRKTGADRRVLISSLNHDYLLMAQNLAPQITTAAVQKTEHPQQLVQYLKSLGVAAYHPEDSLASPEVIRQLRSAGIGVNVFTVNSSIRQRELFDFGVTAVFTDYPGLVNC
jgi:glycerophosphoryl diester phosphodiesterase